MSAIFAAPSRALTEAADAGRVIDRHQYPGQGLRGVALSRDVGGARRYGSFPQRTRLSVSEKDRRGTSICDEKCASAWPPLFATENKDTGQPVYQRYHDMPFDPSAKDVEGFKPLQP